MPRHRPLARGQRPGEYRHRPLSPSLQAVVPGTCLPCETGVTGLRLLWRHLPVDMHHDLEPDSERTRATSSLLSTFRKKTWLGDTCSTLSLSRAPQCPLPPRTNAVDRDTRGVDSERRLGRGRGLRARADPWARRRRQRVPASMRPPAAAFRPPSRRPSPPPSRRAAPHLLPPPPGGRPRFGGGPRAAGGPGTDSNGAIFRVTVYQSQAS
jgi:hypothetical protein